ncbi:52 kDa repressor of the inhibitor of the protein kinase-like [Saccostrea echinata]|uniref:52 kDa repressor of the inhibitor of the protein kinase-like n=1 Tax=Saccostrea echinata TaxID=191078 RepID=UPI002A816EA2|nr:52 kDa repressor of the inhibitor of the protein kinase-like [Saccostrea echinata]
MDQNKNQKKKGQTKLTSFLRKRKDDSLESASETDEYITPTLELSKPEQYNERKKPKTESMDPVNFIQKVLDDAEKSKILSSKWNPSPHEKYSFPVTNGRRYNLTWEDKFIWLRYSLSKDAAFCAPCIAFGQQNQSDKLVTSGLRDWKNATGSKRGTLQIHEESSAHQNALVKAVNLMKVYSGEEKSIKSSISQSYEDTVLKNREILSNIINVVIIALGQRNIPLRGHRWDTITKREDGNFDFFVHWLAKEKPVLKAHLENAAYNAKYLSPDIQNEIIELAGEEVLNSILSRTRTDKWFSVMADECADVANIEQMDICIRYVDENNEVNEDFIGYAPLDSVDAASLSNAILQKLEDCNLDTQYLRGQGYDGASVLSGSKSGVCSRLREVQPLAEYHHCRAHALNLVISSSCKNIPMVRNLFVDVNQLTWFLGASPKRVSIMKRHLPNAKQVDYLIGNIENEETESNKNIEKSFSVNILLKLCETRWSARVDTLSVVIGKYAAILSTLEDVRNESTVSDARTKATAFINMMERSSFIVAIVVAHHILSYMKPLTLALQSSKCGVYKAFVDAQNCKQVINDQRCEEVFQRCIWSKASAIADSIGIELQKPRTAGHMQHRANTVLAGTAEEYYRINTYLPFLDHCVKELNDRFSDETRPSFLAFKLLLGQIDILTQDELVDIIERFQDDLPDRDVFNQEFERWKVFCGNLPNDGFERNSLSNAIMLADSDFYPNLHVIFRILLTMPVGSVPCERSFSAMRRLKH